MNDASTLLHAPEDPADFMTWAAERDWGDGLPLIPPSIARVDAMLSGLGRSSDEEVAVLPPRGGVLTVELAAVNAVLAGCLPEHLPVLLAAVEALLDPAMNLEGLQCTTNPAAPMVIVNGPVRRTARVASQGDALSVGHRANLCVGRALRLLLRNVGGGSPPIDQSVLGSPCKRGLVLAEDEDASPWEPLHVRRGFDRMASVVTTVNVESVINVPAPYRHADGIFCMTGLAMQTGLNLHFSSGVLLVCFTPAHARTLADAGYDVDAVRHELFTRARVHISAFPSGKNVDQASWSRDGDFVLPTRDPSDIEVMVAGSDWPAHSLYFNGWAISGIASRQLPDAPGGQAEDRIARPGSCDAHATLGSETPQHGSTPRRSS